MNTLSFERATEGLAVGDEFASLPSFNKGVTVGALLNRLLDQLDASDWSASVHEWSCITEATQFLMLGNFDDALERASDACKRDGFSDYPQGGQTDMLRKGLACAIDVAVGNNKV
jgi:hypothetical protein